jgi:hypothetical protein
VGWEEKNIVAGRSLGKFKYKVTIIMFLTERSQRHTEVKLCLSLAAVSCVLVVPPWLDCNQVHLEWFHVLFSLLPSQGLTHNRFLLANWENSHQQPWEKVQLKPGSWSSNSTLHAKGSWQTISTHGAVTGQKPMESTTLSAWNRAGASEFAEEHTPRQVFPDMLAPTAFVISCLGPCNSQCDNC